MNRQRKQAESAPPDPWTRYAPLAVCVFLATAVVAVFGQTVDCDFVNYDDRVYVTENPDVQRGLTADGIGWAMKATVSANWHPLTLLSHMADCQFYGLKPGGHHLTSVVLHAATAILLFLVLRRMTGDLWPSAFVATVFAIHPLRVESVAWIAERKDVLSGLFFMLTLWAYVAYVRRPFSWVRYLTVVVLFALGLMAKPMLVTLPFVLLLLDYWPLGRVTFPLPKAGGMAILRRLVAEKVPLLLLSVGSCVATSIAQTEVLARLEKLPLSSRLGNAAMSYVAYLGQLFCPLNLSVFYPHTGVGLAGEKVAAALLLLAGISLGVLFCWRRVPCLPVGWLWYLGMLVPVIGVVQVGAQAMADRYTYLPQIGLCIALAWGIMHLTAAWPQRRWILGVASAPIIAALMGCAWYQTTFWRNSETLWRHALACNEQNRVAHTDLGYCLAEQYVPDKPEYIDEAIEHFKRAIELQPDCLDALIGLGKAWASLNRFDDAVKQYKKALDIDGNCVEAHYNLGVAWARLRRLDEAIAEYGEALWIKPDLAEAHANLGGALEARGRIDEALTHYRTALALAARQGKEALAGSVRARLSRLPGGGFGP
jgi:protein O-mannosyl-transferase